VSFETIEWAWASIAGESGAGAWAETARLAVRRIVEAIEKDEK
jgi:hypothetical protein